jgi:hypothetical protein
MAREWSVKRDLSHLFWRRQQRATVWGGHLESEVDGLPAGA